MGASPALVIYYFGTKDSLLTEALRWSERSFYAAVEEMLHETRLRRRAARRRSCAWCLPDTRRRSGDWGLWFDLWVQAFRHPEVKKDRAELDQQWRDLVARVVRAGVEAGEIGEVDVEEFTIMWAALLDGLVVQVALDDPVVDGALARRIALESRAASSASAEPAQAGSLRRAACRADGDIRDHDSRTRSASHSGGSPVHVRDVGRQLSPAQSSSDRGAGRPGTSASRPGRGRQISRSGAGGAGRRPAGSTG